MDSSSSSLDRFEQTIVFRFARFLPVALFCIATLMLVVSCVAIFYSLVPTTKLPDPPPAPQPTAFKVTRAEIDAFVAKRKSQTEEESEDDKDKSMPPSAEAKAIGEELHAIRARTTDLGLVWADRYETVCTCRGSYTGTCFSSERRKAEIGVLSGIEMVLSPYDNSESTQTVRVEDGKYVVNPSRSEQKLAILRELKGLLEGASRENVRQIVFGWALLRNEREQAAAAERKKIDNEEQSKRKELERAHSNEVSRKELARTLAFSGIMLALGGFMVLGLVLAVLAIERHARQLGVYQSTLTADLKALAKTSGHS